MPSNKVEDTEELSVVPDKKVELDDIIEGACEEVEEVER